MTLNCKDCNSVLVEKTAKRGSNAGKKFLGCPNFGKNKKFGRCKVAINLDDAGLPIETEISTISTDRRQDFSQPSHLRFAQRVNWSDGLSRESGWRTRYVGIGGSLRSEKNFDNSFARTAWLAWSLNDGYEPADVDTRRVLGMYQKLLGRGDMPPIHPDSEWELVRLLGRAGTIKPSPFPGDIAPFSTQRKTPTKAMPIPPYLPFEIRNDITESDFESAFLSWFARRWPEQSRWVIPQPSFDLLLRASGVDAGSCRRCDFLVSIPGIEPFVVEIDGSQHASQSLLDEERDTKLREAGLATIRIGGQEVINGDGPQLDKIGDLVSKAPGASREVDKASWAPVQLHRLVLALMQSVSAGFLAGKRWVIDLGDSTELASQIMGPYLNVLCSLDHLWGATEITPDEVQFIEKTRVTTYRRSDDDLYLKVAAEKNRPDVEIRLEFESTPLAKLDKGEIPVVVVRSTAIPVPVSDLPIESPTRINVRTGDETTAAALRSLLRFIFAKDDFRTGQLDALIEVLSGRDCAVLLPTGAGKSIIYQLAGLCLPGRTVVIDPIVALIEDQVEGLNRFGIDRVVSITSADTKAGRGEQLLASVANADAHFVLISPERLKSQAFRSALRQMSQRTLVNLAVIDEAHCVSEWGHDFRTSYLGIGQTIRDITRDAAGIPPPILALTGTASRSVLRDVLFQLDIQERTPRTIIRPRTFDRPELRYRVVNTTPAFAEAELNGVLMSLAAHFDETPQTFFEPNGLETYSGLIFCPTKSGYHNVVDTANRIRTVAPSVRVYSGGRPKQLSAFDWDSMKRANATAFKTNDVAVLVSTNAFGMGIDKPNIRWVIHFGLPKSIESYYQEVGRAGRDGKPSLCVLLLTEFDARRNEGLLSEDSDLEQLSRKYDAAEEQKTEKDDVVQTMWFHLNTYGGIEEELGVLLDVAERLGPTDSMKRLSLPFGVDDKAREKALHRLMLLGVVEDYLVEYGSHEFTVILNPTTPTSVVESLLNFVERSQPGRANAIKTKVDRDYRKLSDALEVCGRSLLEFIYDTIERSRRRSLREMWLTARESKTDEQLRKRVLEYLSEGDILPNLRELVDNNTFLYLDWEPLLESIDNPELAREWRASTARELASYPDHPGLLIGRAFAEAVDPEGNIREFEFNLESSISSARRNYSTSDEELEKFLRWTENTLRRVNIDASVCARSLGIDFGMNGTLGLDDIFAIAREGNAHAGLLVLTSAVKHAHEIAIATDELLNS